MRHIWTIIAVVLTVIALCGCKIKVEDANVGEMVTKSYDNKDFTEITFGGSIEAEITQDSVYSVKVEATEDKFEQILISQDGNHLYIGFEDVKKVDKIIRLDRTTKCKVYITTPDINLLELSGSGVIGMDALRNSETVNIAILGSGTMVIDTLYAKDVNTTVTGSGNFTSLNIQSTTFTGSVSGSGDIMPTLVNVEEVNAQIGGSGMLSLDLKNCGDVNAQIFGSGLISLSGNAKSLTKNISGSGIIDTDKLKITE